MKTKMAKKLIELKVGLMSSLALATLTLSAFAFAMIAVPSSGPNCPGNCMEYPYSNLLPYFPRDYYWMYIVTVQLLAFLVFVIAHHFNTRKSRKLFSFVSVSLAMIATTVLLSNYFVQYAVVPISVMKGETEGIALLTQYNGHGIFIALEELGFTVMSLAFLFLSWAYKGKQVLEKAMRVIYRIPALVVVISFIYYTIEFGLDRDYRFEVVAISINWLITLAGSLISFFYFYRKLSVQKAALAQEK